jgi:hypothetical protein
MRGAAHGNLTRMSSLRRTPASEKILTLVPTTPNGSAPVRSEQCTGYRAGSGMARRKARDRRRAKRAREGAVNKQLRLGPERAAGGAAALGRPTRQRGLLARIAAWIDLCADCYAATAIYEQLSRLSDGELQRRGLARADLARHVCASAVGSAHSH